jgi:bifunctional DNA-binding transcriptional regulator/antitoxin component of YhaV-PrlF toxin-antitoxin module
MKATLKKFASGMHYFMVDKKTVEKISKTGDKRVMCKLNDTVEFHCALMPKKEGGFFVNVGSKIRNKLGLKEGDVVTATFSVDDSALQFEIPKEFTEVLKTDSKAKRIFNSLTDGNKRGLIYLVTQVKSSDKRIERALKISERLKIGITSPRDILK